MRYALLPLILLLLCIQGSVPRAPYPSRPETPQAPQLPIASSAVGRYISPSPQTGAPGPYSDDYRRAEEVAAILRDRDRWEAEKERARQEIEREKEQARRTIEAQQAQAREELEAEKARVRGDLEQQKKQWADERDERLNELEAMVTRARRAQTAQQEEEERFAARRRDEEQSLAARRRDEEAALKAERERHEALMAAERITHEWAIRETSARNAVTDRQDRERVQQRHVADALPPLVERPSVLASMAAPSPQQPRYHPSPEAYRTYPNANRHENEERDARDLGGSRRDRPMDVSPGTINGSSDPDQCRIEISRTADGSEAV